MNDKAPIRLRVLNRSKNDIYQNKLEFYHTFLLSLVKKLELVRTLQTARILVRVLQRHVLLLQHNRIIERKIVNIF